MCAKCDDQADFNSGVAVGRRQKESRTGANFSTSSSSLSVLPIVRRRTATKMRGTELIVHTLTTLSLRPPASSVRLSFRCRSSFGPRCSLAPGHPALSCHEWRERTKYEGSVGVARRCSGSVTAGLRPNTCTYFFTGICFCTNQSLPFSFLHPLSPPREPQAPRFRDAARAILSATHLLIAAGAGIQSHPSLLHTLLCSFIYPSTSTLHLHTSLFPPITSLVSRTHARLQQLSV